MHANSYSDLTRDSKLLKKLLKEHDAPLQLSACQEIIAKLYRFSSFHEAQRVLTTEGHRITKPSYLINVHDLRKTISSQNTDPHSVWTGRALSLLDTIINSVFKDNPNTSPEKLKELTTFTSVEHLSNDEHVSRYLDALPGYLFENKICAEEHHNYVAMQITHALSPYLLDFTNYTDFNDKQIPRIVMSAKPGSGKTMWTACMSLNWLHNHPGGKLIILDVGPSWSGFIQYLKCTEKQLKIMDIISSELSDVITQFDADNFNDSDIIRISINSSHSKVPDIYSAWERMLKSIDIKSNTVLMVFDEYQRVSENHIDHLLKDNYIYVYSTQWVGPILNLSDTIRIEPFLTVIDSEMAWRLSSSKDDLLIKYLLTLKTGYQKAIALLSKQYPKGTLRHVLDVHQDSSIQIARIVESLSKYQEP